MEKNILIRYCLQALSTAETLKCHINGCYKIKCKKMIKMPKNGAYVKFKSYETKITLQFIIYTDFESILVTEDNGMILIEKKYQKHVACSYNYKLVCVDDKFSKRFKSYLGEDNFYNFINSMREEIKCCSDVMENVLTKDY